MSGAGAVQSEAGRAEDRVESTTRGGDAAAGEAARSGHAGLAAATPGDHRAGVRHPQTGHGLSPLDGAGTGKRPHAVGAAVRGVQLEEDVQILGCRATRPGLRGPGSGPAAAPWSRQFTLDSPPTDYSLPQGASSETASSEEGSF